MPEIVTLVLAMLGIIGLIFLTYYATRWLNRRVTATTGRSMQILERIMLGQDKSLIVVKAGEKILLLGVTAHHVDKIAEFSAEEYPLPAEGGLPPLGGTFLENLKKAAAEHAFVKPFLPKETHEEHKDEP